MDKREDSLNMLPDLIGSSLHATIIAVALPDKQGKINDFRYEFANGQELRSIPSADFKNKLMVFLSDV